jgi:2-keto-4-pentenoate hydratase/2-oxohepta-3-ene-1,7-dioic acid hydratase in catechol pathway
MKLVRVGTASDSSLGVLVDDMVHRLVGDPLVDGESGEVIGAWADLPHLPPCVPSKVICVGRNYAGHIREMGRDFPEEPFAFLKGPNTVVGDGASIRRPSQVERFDFEGELAMVIGRRASKAAATDLEEVVLGYTNANDLTVRDWQVEGRQWFRAKSSDTFCPLGPFIETEVPDPENLALRTWVNGELRQDGRTDDLVFGLGQLLEYLTATVTLEPGDVVLTGTPGGVGPLVPGDVVEVGIDGLGVLRNDVVAA